MRGIRVSLVALLATVALAACGSSGSDTSGGSAVTSLTQIPSVDTVVSGGSATASVSASKDVSGTPPLLVGASADADTYFWNGVVGDIIDAGSATAAQQSAFWQGEGSCRVAQNIGYAFQNIQQVGTSLCYMKGMPVAATGATIDSAPDGVTQANLFDQSVADRIVKVQVRNTPSGSETSSDENIYITVLGTASGAGANGYAVNLLFCTTDDTSATGYDNIRINRSTSAMTEEMYQTSGQGDFLINFNGVLTVDASGNPIFNTSETQSVTAFFNSDQWGVEKNYVSVLGDVISTKGWGTNMMDGVQTGQRYSYNQAQFSGATIAAFRVLQTGYTGYESQNTFTYTGASEYQSTYYASVGADGAYYSVVDGFGFTTDGFWSGTLEFPSSAATTLAGYSCSVTPDVVVTLDMSDPAIQAVETECQSDLSGDNMNFCDGDDIQAARAVVFASGS